MFGVKIEIEREIAGIYTHDMFQEELEHSYYHYTAHKIKKGGGGGGRETTINFLVKHCSFEKDVS